MSISNKITRLGPFGLSGASTAVVAAGALMACVPTASAATATFIEDVVAFTDRHCSSCHNDVDKEGGLDLTTLSFNPADEANFTAWVKVHDRVQNGEMPPKEKKRPEGADLSAFLRTVSATLVKSETELVANSGRATRRRLNRSEYENALRDILNAPWIEVKAQLPEDGEAFRFNKVSTALDVSHVHMARYMSAANQALRQIMAAKLVQPPTTLKRYYARESMAYSATDGNPDRGRWPIINSEADVDALLHKAPITVGEADPVRREQEAMAWVHSTFVGFNANWLAGFRAPVAGRYRMRFSGYSIWVGPWGSRTPLYSFIGYTSATAPGGNAQQLAVVPPEWHRPNYFDVSRGRGNEPITIYARGGSINRLLGGFDVTPEAGIQEIPEVWLMPNEFITTDSARFMRTRPGMTKIDSYTNPLARRDGMPGVAFRWMEVEGPLYDERSTSGYKLLFGNLPMKRVEEGTPSVAVEALESVPAGRGRGARGGAAMAASRAALPLPEDATLMFRAAYAGRQQGRNISSGSGGLDANPPILRPVQVEVQSPNPRQDAEQLLRGFMARVYRSPVEEVDVTTFLDLIKARMDSGAGFASSMLAGYTAVLASPKFLFVDEKPGRLDDRALATRLALFLWNSAPDEVLRARAERRELSQPGVLKAEVERMLSDPRSERFVNAFLDYWLELRRMEETSPSTTLYNDYYLDDSLVEASVAETRMFFTELVAKDLPARNVVDSNFTYVNRRLATHYGLEGDFGYAMQRVILPKDSIRGGMTTMASVLKVTANGTTTSPVLRGKWLQERIMGFEMPPPPAAVPAVEPDIRGAVTIRQQLDKHRADESCAMCHRKLDPPGFALESFDVMGAWRDRYRAESKLITPELGNGHHGWPFVFHYAQQVDPSGQLPDGRTFKDVRGFKKLLLSDEPQIARNLAEQLSVYATGSRVRFSDRAQIEKIVAATASGEYGVRGLIHELVQSDLFRSK